MAARDAWNAPGAGAEPETGLAPDAGNEPDTGLAQEAAPGLPSTMAPEPEHEFDLDLNGDEPPATAAPVPPAATQSGHAAADAAPIPDDAFDLDFDIDAEHAEPAPASPWEDPAALPRDAQGEAPAAPLHDSLHDSRHDRLHDALHDSLHDPLADPLHDPATAPSAGTHRFDSRREPTLDIPDDHLAAVALHDSFELDAYPHAHDSDLHSTDERAHNVDAGVWRGRDDIHHLGGEPATDAPASAAPPQDDDDADDDIVTLSSAAATGATAATLAPEPSAPATPVSAREPDEPGFVKRSRRQERWGKASRIAMACALPLLLAGLAYQAVATFRNPLAAAVPALKPALVSACALMGCKVELPSQLDALSIEQGELQTMADNIFSFSTSLRNQSATAQSWPHVELILNDGADKPVLRRVFAPRDYLPAGADVMSGFLPRSEQPVKLYFELSRVKASGYHIAVFYP